MFGRPGRVDRVSVAVSTVLITLNTHSNASRHRTFVMVSRYGMWLIHVMFITYGLAEQQRIHYKSNLLNKWTWHNPSFKRGNTVTVVNERSNNIHQCGYFFLSIFIMLYMTCWQQQINLPDVVLLPNGWVGLCFRLLVVFRFDQACSLLTWICPHPVGSQTHCYVYSHTASVHTLLTCSADILTNIPRGIYLLYSRRHEFGVSIVTAVEHALSR